MNPTVTTYKEVPIYICIKVSLEVGQGTRVASGQNTGYEQIKDDIAYQQNNALSIVHLAVDTAFQEGIN